MIGDIMQPTHLLFVLVIALLVLGPKKLPEVGRQLGNGIRDFRAAINGERTEREELDTAQGQSGGGTQVHESPAQPAENQFTPEAGASTPDEHEFAHEPVEPASDEHQFAHLPVESAAEEHQFAHAASEPAQGEHQFAHAEPVQAPTQAPESGATLPAGEHEFAYEPARSAEKPSDPLT